MTAGFLKKKVNKNHSFEQQHYCNEKL